MQIRIGTRGSALALWQAEHVQQRLQRAFDHLQVSLEIIKTKGDKIQDVPLAKVGGKGLFVKEIEEALLERRVDLAVHSIKDVPAELVDGLYLGAIPQREDPRDALVSRAGLLAQLPAGARVGTSSLRRRCQLAARRPDLEIHDLRGNVDTRLRKLDEGQYDAVLLAAAGLKRLGRQERITETLAPWQMLPAVGQGALGIEIRQGDESTAHLVEVLHDPATALCVRAERAFLLRLEGGCQVPLAAHATLEDQRLSLRGLVGHPSGNPIFQDSQKGDTRDPEQLGQRLADALLSRGADRVLAEVYH